MKKFIRMIAVVMAAIFCLQIIAFAEGDPNVDNGGGNLLDGSKENFWSPGNEGVRVTVVDSQTGAIKSASVDYTNTHPDDIVFHFGKVSKAEYVGAKQFRQVRENTRIKTRHSRFPQLFPMAAVRRILKPFAAILQMKKLWKTLPSKRDLPLMNLRTATTS